MIALGMNTYLDTNVYHPAPLRISLTAKLRSNSVVLPNRIDKVPELSFILSSRSRMYWYDLF